MRKAYASLITFLVFWGLVLGCSSQAFATHGQAGEMTYESLGNNQYRVRVSFFRDCSGNSIPGSLSLKCQSNGCATAQVTGTLNPVGQTLIGQPYCNGTQGGNVCNNSTSSLANYETRIYQGIVTLPPAAEWILSIEIDARPFVTNIVNSNMRNLRLEATLNNLITLPGGGTQTIVNNSPVFTNTNLPVPFVCVNQQSTLAFTATDADRLNNGRPDSLAYTLETPLYGCSQPIVYTPYPSPCVGGTVAGCNYQCPPLPLAYSPQLPLVVKLDTVGTCPNKRIVPRFSFNATAGSFTFVPGRFLNTPSAQGDNKYAVVGKVTEFRKINGRYYKVGSIRRDFLVIVIDCGNNIVPSVPTGNAPDTLSHSTVVNLRDTTAITVYTCNYSRINLRFTDPNPTDQLTVFYPTDINTALLQNGGIGSFTISGNGTTRPVGTFFFQPQASLAGTQVLLNFRVEDNACPIKGVQYRTIILNVKSKALARATAAAGTTGLGTARPPAVCPGGAINLVGIVNRPDSVQTAPNGPTIAQVYTYQWSALNNNGLNPAQANSANITVNPTVTTRYRLRITPTLGASIGGCDDTTSVVVRVVPQPVAAITASSVIACSSDPIVLRGSASRNDNLPDVYTYSWSGGGLPAGTSGQVLTVRPTAPVTRYFLRVNGASPNGCTDTTSIVLRLKPPTLVSATTSADFVCPTGPATLQASARRADGVVETYQYVWRGATGLPATQNPASPTITVRPTATTRYFLSVTNAAAPGACPDTTSILVRLGPAAVARFAVTDSTDANNRRTSTPPVFFSFANQSTVSNPAGNFQPTTYTWTYRRLRDASGLDVTEAAVPFGNGLRDPGKLQLDVAGTYLVQLKAELAIDGVACTSSTAARLVTVPDLSIPNVITPNGDKLNDVFRISSASTLSKLEIYNRWGRKVKEYTNYNNDWDGEGQPGGLYYYLITDRNGAQSKGWIELVR